jgi:hypothetical protein
MEEVVHLIAATEFVIMERLVQLVQVIAGRVLRRAVLVGGHHLGGEVVIMIGNVQVGFHQYVPIQKFKKEFV